jgi:hypothetical protein
MCGESDVEISTNKINEWIRIDRRRKMRADRRHRFFGRVRGVFIFLLAAAIMVFALNHRVEIQSLASAKLAAVMQRSSASDKLRQNAVNYENQVDKIAQ